MAPNNEPQYERGTIIPPHWVPITAIHMMHGVCINSQNVYVPSHWIPDTQSNVLVYCVSYDILDLGNHTFDKSPEHIRYIFGSVQDELKDIEPDYNELYSALVECGSIPQDGKVDYVDMLKMLPDFANTQRLSELESKQYKVVIYTEEFPERKGVPMIDVQVLTTLEAPE